MVADTSKPTGEGNFQVLKGMLRACAVPLAKATVGLIGCGNIGMHIVRRLREEAPGVTVLVCESRAERRKELEGMGIRCWTAAAKSMFLTVPVDALVVNAAGGTLDAATVEACAANPRLQVICGSENLALVDAADAGVLRDARKIYAPTELGGMMGYLTAVEEYLSALEGVPFDIGTLVTAAGKLEAPAYAATARVLAGGHRETFEDAVTSLYA